MLIRQRASARLAYDVPLGSVVVARPPTTQPITGTVVGVDDRYTVVIDAGGFDVAVDVEDIATISGR
jgi:hypothetical protein